MVPPYTCVTMTDRLGQVFRGNEPVAIAIELAVIWLVVYLALRFLRGTRGAGVLKGVSGLPVALPPAAAAAAAICSCQL